MSEVFYLVKCCRWAEIGGMVRITGWKGLNKLLGGCKEAVGKWKM